jgi:hypothetical protein
MPSQRLTPEQAERANELLESVRARLLELSNGDGSLLFSLRRRVFIRLSYDERGTPAQRTKLKNQKWKDQRGKCAICGEDLPAKGAELDRFDALGGYVSENTQLIHHDCHRDQQSERGFK